MSEDLSGLISGGVCDEFHLVLISALSEPDGAPTLEGMNAKQLANQRHEEVKGWESVGKIAVVKAPHTRTGT